MPLRLFEQNQGAAQVTKKEIVREIANELKVDQTLTKRIVQRCLDRMIEVLAEQGRLELRNFGVFEVKERAARKARNPKTNQEVLVPAKRVITFQAGKNIAKYIQESDGPASPASAKPARAESATGAASGV
jgi:DNA-binding protein HU-beta/integration host factor subunit beta